MLARGDLAACTATADPDPIQFLGGWSAVADVDSAHLLAVEALESGYRLSAPAEAVGVQLRRPFIGPRASRGATARFRIRVSTDNAREFKRSLVNLSISGSIDGRRRTLASVHASAFETPRERELLVTFEWTWVPRATNCQVELRFRRVEIDCTIYDIEFNAEIIPRSRGVLEGPSAKRHATQFAGTFPADDTDLVALDQLDWRVEIGAGVGDGPRVSLDTDGLRVAFEDDGRPLVLSRSLPLPEKACGNLLRIDLRLRGGDAEATIAFLSQIAVGLLGDGETPRSFLKLSPHIAYAESADVARLIVEAPCLGKQKRAVLELSFLSDEGEFLLKSIEIVLSARSRDPRSSSPLAIGAPPAPARIPANSRSARISVVGWQLADNAVGRAFLLADMAASTNPIEIVGPLFGPEGTTVWEPLRDARLPMRAFHARGMRQFLADALTFAKAIDCDVAYLSKPRLPAILLGLLIHYRTGCGLLLDIDDHELSFFRDAAPIDIGEAVARFEARAADLVAGQDDDPSRGMSALADEDRPDGELWTCAAETLIATIEDHTVSNAALRDRFGGIVVRHARDETVFRPDPGLRAEIRAQFGIDPDDRVILFIGTPRRHKGLERLAEAMERVDDQRLRLVVIGTIYDRGMERDLLSFAKARISLHPNQPWERLPELGRLADGVCLLQDPESPIARYQIPAKLTDALALGVPVATTRVEPLADVPSPSVVTFIDDDDALDTWLRFIAEGDTAAAGANRRIDWFQEELSYRVNRERIQAAVQHALERPRVWKPEWTELFVALNRCYGSSLPEQPPAWAKKQNEDAPPPAPAVRRRMPFDLVCFWKQNDTGVYGRRHDMLLKYLRESEQVRSIVQFDAPIRVAALRKMLHRGQNAALDQSRLTADATIRRFLSLDDQRDVARRVFVYADQPGDSFYGQPLDVIDGYADFVAAQLPPRAGSNRVALVWPVAQHFAELVDTVGFDKVVVDLVDDERAMTRNPDRASYLDVEYQRTLAAADFAFANCTTLRDRFPDFRERIRVVPNACEVSPPPRGPVPRDMAHLPGPIIGYVGNLRGRLDVALIEDVARLHPEWSVVLVGSAHGNPDVLRLQAMRNVHFIGPRTYEEAQQYIHHFDVAIMPHLRNALSDSMNPLKLYVYVALGKHVIATRVMNIEELEPYVDVADDRAEFLTKLELAVARAQIATSRPPTPDALWSMSWQQRVATILATCTERPAF